MILLIDASAAVELVLKRTHSAPISNAVADADLVLAPDLYISEVANALWKHSHITGESLDASVLDDAVAIPDEYLPSHHLYREAFAMGVRNAHPVYDCIYLVASQRRAATLVTLDQRLRRLSLSEGVVLADL